ncbi:hypothetical protein KSC_043420 [Ktedonobacter sp. SOSP1-52]|uniref:DUF1772 domain-containing protein n=1 Tax=Ktedonobacter sp. SOSP1-52 TaxID=2778366 RepID=UPI0019164D47|nr:DUF1772 domain-containing protein [Ktedonobacter sp. SOSP1-52]GHO65450.1 hypothetical protein KSC_043420 [Ktedonobacter sp. SOSP1-52]
MYTITFYALLFLNLASAGLVTGGVMVMAAAYNPLLADLSQQETLTVHRGIGRYIDRWQPKLAILAILSGLVELWFSQQLWQTVCILLGVAGIFALSTISRSVSVPLSRKIVAWTPAAGEAHLVGMKTQWIRVHNVRAACGLFGFLFFIVSILQLVAAR